MACTTLFQNKMINETLDLVYMGFILSQEENTEAFQSFVMQHPAYVPSACGGIHSSAYGMGCPGKLLRGPNFESMMMQVKIQNTTIMSDALFTEDSGLSVEVSTATSYCVKVLPDPNKFPIRSGVGNGVEILLDLETFDNGDQEVLGDGVSVLVADDEDYTLADLHGFSIGPGSAAEIQIQPVIISIAAAALKNFGYIDRKCVDTTIDTGLNSLDGIDGSYSLSNCLVSATVTEILKT